MATQFDAQIIEAATRAKEAMKAFERSMPKIDLSTFNIQHNTLAVFPEWEKQFTKHVQPLKDLQRQLEQVSEPARRIMEDWAEASRTLRQSFNGFMPSSELSEQWNELAKAGRQKHTLEQIGVLPHTSTPLSLLNIDDYHGTKAALQDHYMKNWAGVSADIRKRVLVLHVDDEAKATLAEALEAHASGHYRAVCRLLLPEIERVARIELSGNQTGKVYVDTVVGKPAGSLPINATNLPGYLALGLYRCLTEHLYKKVDATNRAQLEQDPIPNRHAAIHGLVVYSSFWNSLNVIFMTDYAFQLISTIKVEQRLASAA
jgi:hypothetical protein